jgi:hypothetical protein
MPKPKTERWKLSKTSKRPPTWLLEQEGCANKAGLVAKHGPKVKMFVRMPPPAVRAVA